MTVLVIADHDNTELKESTLNTITAAANFNSDIHVLVVGAECASVGEAASKVSGVSKILLADNAELEHPLAEVIAP